MKNNQLTRAHAIIIAAAIAFVQLATLAHAQVQTTVTVVIECNNANISVSPRCTAPVDWFMDNQAGGWYGQLTSGVTFSQFPIVDGIYLHKMVIESAYWYIDAEGAFWADNDTQALSIHLTRI